MISSSQHQLTLTMASHNLFLCVLLFLVSSPPVLSNDVEDNLLQGINSYRTSMSLSAVGKNGNAECVAESVADKMGSKTCTSANGTYSVPGAQPQLSTYQDILTKCNVDINTTRDGVILPVCIPNLVPTLLLTNYTRTQYARYLNDSKFTGAGLASEDDWMVLILTTNTAGGAFTSGCGIVGPPITPYFAFALSFLLFFLSALT